MQAVVLSEGGLACRDRMDQRSSGVDAGISPACQDGCSRLLCGRMLEVNAGSFWAAGSVMMIGQGSVYKRCGCVDPVTRRQLGRRCPRLAGGRHGSWYLELELPAGPDGRRCRIRRDG